MGQILQERYQILQVLGAGAFGQTYVVCDLLDPEQPRYALKHYPLHHDYPNLVQMSKRAFATEVQMLKKLGIHPQIPQFIDAFEADRGFYLVQELIVGQTLNDYLSYLKQCDRAERETEVLALLNDVLVALDFIHRQDAIHCDLKPNNLIKRARDGKWVLIDFGNAQPVRWSLDEGLPTLPPKSAIAVSPSGYLAAELLIGRPYPNSDIYALGIIGIEMLTGADPAQLQLDLDRGELAWSHLRKDEIDLAGCSEALEAVLREMVRYSPQQRYQSAREVFGALAPLCASESLLGRGSSETDWLREEETTVGQALPHHSARQDEPSASTVNSVNSQWYESAIDVEFVEAREGEDAIAEPKELESLFDLGVGPGGTILPSAPTNKPRTVKSSRVPLLVGAGVTLAAANTAAIALGMYAIGDVENADPGAKLLSQAAEAFQRGQLDDAIALAKAIPSDSLSYSDSQAAIQQWQKDWKQAAVQFQELEQALAQQQWDVVITSARSVPAIGFWQEKVAPLAAQAKENAEAEARVLLDKAFARARQRDFTRALGYLEQISPYSETGATIQPKLSEYRTKQQIRAKVLLQQAYNLAQQRDFQGAIAILEHIPGETPAGAIAQSKIIEYTQKQQVKERVDPSPHIYLRVYPQSFRANSGAELLKTIPQTNPRVRVP